MRRVLLALLFHFCVPPLLSGRALADPHPMGAGGQPGPGGPTEVAIAREVLDIDVRLDRVVVVADLRLENRGAATTMSVGFPCRRTAPPGVTAFLCNTPLEVQVAGRRVKARLRWQSGQQAGDL